MSVQQFFDYLSQHSLVIVLYFVVIFILALGLSLKHKNSPSTLTAKILSTLIFLVSVPGIMATILVFYSLFFIRQNLLEVNIILYFLPIISMTVTLFFISKNVSLNTLPGFDRLSGLMTVLVLTGMALLMLYKLRFVVGFFASIQSLLIFGVIFYFVFKSAMNKLTGKK